MTITARFLILKRNTMKKLIALTLLTLTLASWGYRGPLYLPENGKPAKEEKKW
jgi:predicted small lipoprotein YifL